MGNLVAEQIPVLTEQWNGRHYARIEINGVVTELKSSVSLTDDQWRALAETVGQIPEDSQPEPRVGDTKQVDDRTYQLKWVELGWLSNGNYNICR